MEKFLLSHADRKEISFHMPGHKGSRIYKEYGHSEFLEKIMDCDITEIPGADNLYQAEGIVKSVQERYAKLYEVKKSYMLINSTSAGLIASVMATVPKNGQLIMTRNCHKSVFNALNIAEVKPVYAKPELDTTYGIAGEISPKEIKRCIEENPNAKAVILPSPNYYGICSDIKGIADICHQNNVALIVDQAHGAHLQFFHKYSCGKAMPLPAEKCDADIVVNSIHKTLASFTQSAVLNLNSKIVDQYILEDKLQAIQSTSPSYLLMASLDVNADIIEKHGRELFNQWKENIDWFYNEGKKLSGIKFLDAPNMDKTKINIDAGIHGSQLEKYLIEHNIIPELTTGNILMAMSGIGNVRKDYENLLSVLGDKTEIANLVANKSSAHGRNEQETKVLKSQGQRSNASHNNENCVPQKVRLQDVPEKKKFVKLEDSEGLVAASSLIPYPPGIPLVCPGEEITKDAISYIKELRLQGEKVVGLDDRGMVQVGL